MKLTRGAVISVLGRRWLAWEIFDARARINGTHGYGAEAQMAKECLERFIKYGRRARWIGAIHHTGWKPTLLEMEAMNGRAL